MMMEEKSNVYELIIGDKKKRRLPIDASLEKSNTHPIDSSMDTITPVSESVNPSFFY